jgi:hypothetical protein
MNEFINYNINEERKRIKQELKKLAERKKQLYRQVKGLKVYMTFLNRLRAEVCNAKSVAELEKIVSRGELSTQIRKEFIRLTQYFINKELEQKIEDTKEALEEVLEEIKAVRWEQRSANICPKCHGKGQLSETEYIREDRMVHPVLHVTTCPLCRGKGIIV